jgi:RNA polymerase sigma-70 factor (ECF subfamily)
MKSMDNYGAEHDLELIRKTQQGSLDAFNHLVLNYQDLLYNHAFFILGVRQSAEDATQESIVKAFQKIDQFRGGSFRSWLFKILTNTCYDELRRLKRHPADPLYPEDENGDEFEAPLWLVDPSISVMSMVEQKELIKTLYQYLYELSGIYRNVITLVDLYEFNYNEAADILSVPLGTIKSRLARARVQMKVKFQKSLDPAPNFAIFEVQPA